MRGCSRCASRAIGYLLPDLWLGRKTRQHAKAITNGLPDVLDLMIVCIEAGSRSIRASPRRARSWKWRTPR